MIDWTRDKLLLVDGTRAAFAKFYRQHPEFELVAVGYTFEVWNTSPAFSICANSRQHLAKTIADYRVKWPNTPEHSIRWASGDFEYCAGILLIPDEFGPEWESEATRLHKLSLDEEHAQEIYDGLVEIACAALAELAREGLFDDWTRIDFNVAEYGDDQEVIKQRDQQIRESI